MKLGEVLLAEGVIEPHHLKEALDAQLIYGGHLGTCLIELGYLQEELLGKALAWTFGVAYAPHPMFLDVPRYVIGAVPQKLVEKHSAIPFRLKDKVLDVAMIDPRNLQAIDEIRFASGYAVQTWIAPEVRIFQAMERYYDVPRRIRYVTLCRQLEKEGGPSDPATALYEHPERESRSTRPGAAEHAVGESEEVWLRTAAPRTTVAEPIEDRDPQAATLPAPSARREGSPPRDRRDRAGATPPGAHARSAPPAGSVPSGQDFPRSAGDPERSVRGAAVPGASSGAVAGTAGGLGHPLPGGQALASAQPDTLSATSDLLCRAKSQDQVADLVLACLEGRLARRILFKVQGSSAYVWRTAGAGIDTDTVASIRFPILSEPLFGLLHGDDYFLGPLPSDPALQGFYAKLGVEGPSAVLLLPIHLNDQLIAMLYADAGRGGVMGGDVETYRRLAEKTALALGLVQTKQRIRAI